METPNLRVRVARKTPEAADIALFELVHAEGGGLPAFSAGSHIDVHLPNGLVRQYSLCNDPGENHRYLICVLREAASRGGSAALHEQVKEGDVLAIGAPRNNFPLASGAAHTLLLAGGIGITPMLSMADRLAFTHAAFQLHCCVRTPERAAFRDRIAAASFVDAVHWHFDDGPPDQRLQIDTVLAGAPVGTHLYVCGPAAFIEWALSSARARGWPDSRLHWEFFGSNLVKTVDETGFTVKLAGSGKLVTVAAHQTVVQALADAGIEVAVSCEQGVCGTCLTRVLEGEPDHRDLFLTPAEQARNDQFTPCCSRSKSALLVLDL